MRRKLQSSSVTTQMPPLQQISHCSSSLPPHSNVIEPLLHTDSSTASDCPHDSAVVNVCVYRVDHSCEQIIARRSQGMISKETFGHTYSTISCGLSTLTTHSNQTMGTVTIYKRQQSGMYRVCDLHTCTLLLSTNDIPQKVQGVVYCRFLYLGQELSHIRQSSTDNIICVFITHYSFNT